MVGLLASSTVFTRCSNTKSEQQEEVKDHAHEEDDASDELVYRQRWRCLFQVWNETGTCGYC